MENAKVYMKKVLIPTYEVGEAQKNPMFLEKRVYQGSSGKVYPYPTIESISDKKKEREYEAVILENEYLEVMVLPELGGRIQRAYDKTNGYDFVYYNHVIKPALVGLTGPWISGGIEFNWPQHHRPSTYLPLPYRFECGEDGSAAVLINDVDEMHGTKVVTKIALHPNRAYIEITGQLYNRTPLPQTFLWWANPAVAVNDNTQSIFPPDVHAVMDHGKRDVSRFPIATGVYYKKDYSDGVDISRYKNIPVPTSYMAEKSHYDFVGGYDYGREAGLLHVADHHISPGKKQWTWGCGEFGRAWDRNLTDEDGPYIELMTGVYTDNQPDFTWLKPFEEKTFTQYFMPYKAVGQVKNATKEAALSLVYKEGKVRAAVYATSEYKEATVKLCAGEKVLFEEMVELSPVKIFQKEIPLADAVEEELSLSVWAGGKCLVSYKPEKEEIPELPEPASAIPAPEKLMTNEELYLAGQHLEQYRHATFLPDGYYLEGLKRDPGDIRINNAYGKLLLSRGQFSCAEGYFRKALQRLTLRNPNPYHSETYYLLGLLLFYKGQDALAKDSALAKEFYKEAYEYFYKAAWSAEQQEKAYYYLAALAAREEKWEEALAHIEKSLIKNAHNVKARGLKAYLLRKLKKEVEALVCVKDNLALDPFDFVSQSEKEYLGAASELGTYLEGNEKNSLILARDYAEFGAYQEAYDRLFQNAGNIKKPLAWYYMAYFTAAGKLSDEEDGVLKLLLKAESLPSDYCFPNKLEDIAVLRFAVGQGCKKKAPYYLGNLFYDKRSFEEAVMLWELSAGEEPGFATVHRNLAIAYYNKKKDAGAAQMALERAFKEDTSDARVFLELDQLYKKIGKSAKERLAGYEKYPELKEFRDDLYVEYVTLLNEDGRYKEALANILVHHFHPWEGGEGKITRQYEEALLGLAKENMKEEKFEEAEELLKRALVYPENLGEGKLEGTKDNHIYYHLGLCAMAQGREEEAKGFFALATLGTDEPAGAMYYNDQPAQMILYQGLAWEKLGEAKRAKTRFYRLIDYGEKHLRDHVEIDYFAVSLPDFLVFDEDYTVRNRAHCYYLMALGYLGLGEMEKSGNYFGKAADTHPAYRADSYGVRLPK